MVDACKAKNLPEPYYEIRPDSVAIVFRYKEVDCTSNCTSGCTSNCEIEITDRQRLILTMIMSDNEKTAPQIARQIGISIRSVRIDLKALRDGGFITKETDSTRSPWVVLKKG